MLDGINHDEHQFLAPAALVAREGLLPYRDFPLFHLPDLTFVYALFYKCENPLLLARLFNVLCAVASVCLIFAYSFQKFFAWPFWRRFGVAAGFAGLMLFAPLFIETSGKTWNHDLPVLCTILAIWLHTASAKNSGRKQWLCAAASGLCFGLAVGSRLTFAPLAAPFLLAIWFFPRIQTKQKLVLAALFSLATLVALLPVIWTFCAASHQFLFGNFEFPRLPLLDPTQARAQKTIKLWRKARFFVKEVAEKNPAVFLLFFVAAIPVLGKHLRTRGARDFESLFFALLIPFVFFGCFAPTRYQYQHYYALLPVCVMATIHALSTVVWRQTGVWFVSACLLFAVAAGAKGYRPILKIADVDDWVPIESHRLGLEMQKLVPAQGKVLTLAPIVPLEAGLKIYPEFATGPFAMRLAHLVAPERRKIMHLVSREDLRGFLRADPPAAILLGYESAEVEKPLREFAERNGYRSVQKRKSTQIWVRRLEKP